MVDGYALIEVNTKGDSRIKEVNFFDIRLGDNFERDDIVGWLEGQYPKPMENVLLLVTMDYHCQESYHPEYGTDMKICLF